MRNKSPLLLLAAAAILAAGGFAAQQSAAQTSAASVKVATRRITESQYRNTIRDAFGPGIVINARFEPEQREDGLLAVGSAHLSITTSGLEQYISLSKQVADQALDPKRRTQTVGCEPSPACTKAFIERYGQVLFRRPLTPAETAIRVQTAARGADFHDGLKLALTTLLAAPEFLFRIEAAEPDPAAPGQYRLDAYTKAARLSYLFWDAPPDAELLAAATSGAIHTKPGLDAQIARLAASPRLQDGAQAFFTDMLQFDQFDALSKDAEAYPKFSQAVADAAREQTLKTVVDLTVVKARDYRDIFTANDTFLTRELAAVYNVPFASTQPWAAYTFAPASERSGVLTQVSFLALFSHPAASSPTKRGVKVNEIFFCEPTPDPPANVDFSKVQALDKGTVRVRLLDHMDNAGCASCHRRSDPPGLALEHFDGAGQLRTTENGARIDVSASLDGKAFTGAAGLGQYLRNDPRAARCLVRNVFAYGVGRPIDDDDDAYIAAQTKAFSTTGAHKLPALMSAVAASPEFFKARLPRGAVPAKVASLSPGAAQ